jgi:hypothetical protein
MKMLLESTASTKMSILPVATSVQSVVGPPGSKTIPHSGKSRMDPSNGNGGHLEDQFEYVSGLFQVPVSHLISMAVIVPLPEGWENICSNVVID